MNKIFSVKQLNTPGELSRKVISFLGLKIKLLDSKYEFRKYAKMSNRNLFQTMYLRLQMANDNELFIFGNDCTTFILSNKCKNLDYDFFYDFILTDSYDTKLYEFKRLNETSILYNEHIQRLSKGEVLWKYSERYSYVEHKYISCDDYGKVFINSIKEDGSLYTRQCINGITVGEFLKNKTYEEKREVLEKMFDFLFSKYCIENDKSKISVELSDCKLWNIMIDFNGNFHYIDFDCRYKEDLERSYCIYFALYNYDKKLYYDLLNKYNCEDKHEYYSKRCTAKNLIVKNKENADLDKFIEDKKKYFTEYGTKPNYSIKVK